jgi:hypothetical protein
MLITPYTIQKFTSSVAGLLALMAAMPAMASPVAAEVTVSPATSLVAERDVVDPRMETISVEEVTNRGFLHRYWEFKNATANGVPEDSSALEKRQWTGDWNCRFNSGGMYASGHLFTLANSTRQQGLALVH